MGAIGDAKIAEVNKVGGRAVQPVNDGYDVDGSTEGDRHWLQVVGEMA